jgi:RNA polymerase sigma factor (sigma-70 family)
MFFMMTETELTDLVGRAQGGDKTAVHALLAELRDDVYRLALRMHGPLDAEDLTQEILVKVVTHLSEWRRESALRTWVMRIAMNHALNAKRTKLEGFSLEMMREQNGKMLAMDVATLPEADESLLAEEIRRACTQAGMLALDRDHRAAFVLGYVFELPSETAAEVLGIEPAAFRKRLQRAKDRAMEFLTTTCGLINPEAPCRCQKQVRPSIAAGMIDPRNPLYLGQRTCRPDARQFNWALAEVKDMEARFRALVQSHPDYAASGALVDRIRDIVDSGTYRFLKN